MAILITGGAGYIGSHTAMELLQSCNLPDSEVVIIDNMQKALHSIERYPAKQATDAPQHPNPLTLPKTSAQISPHTSQQRNCPSSPQYNHKPTSLHHPYLANAPSP